MNKYQYALNDLINQNYDDIEVLQELVDKETPMKPYYLPQWSTAYCPVCKSNLGDNPRCRECGQVIDWSDEE